jgi:hypothetical protein
MSVPGSNTDNSAADKISAPGPLKAGDQVGQQAAGDDNATMPASKPRREVGGPEGPDPTRYGDWERKGRCIDF